MNLMIGKEAENKDSMEGFTKGIDMAGLGCVDEGIEFGRHRLHAEGVIEGLGVLGDIVSFAEDYHLRRGLLVCSGSGFGLTAAGR
ncbi:hypothetical protein GUJ93_ZPchr0010g10538 [Zizania palustris]|uniref:Uncharacterized protein n=1 Tax=Zizania palustris TaxID=103762 RepID=A0A8J6BA55_ZIZPA|nr:hypothetical protein GUJ93_ZPchr0010g10538 [Zizania palustris]